MQLSKVSKKTDVWSLGCVLAFLICNTYANAIDEQKGSKRAQAAPSLHYYIPLQITSINQ